LILLVVKICGYSLRYPGIALVLLLLFTISQAGCVPTSPQLLSEVEISIPAQSDWVDYGTIFSQGDEGEWDYYLYGGFTNTVVKKDGVFYLYYQGASDYQTAFDETVLWRAIGVATSPDGMNFTKYDGNPIITWFPNEEGEEGAVSGGVTLNEDGEFILYYGANTALNSTTVNADGRLAVSQDGLMFTDQGVVLDHRDVSVWGFGDELFPIMTIQNQGEWLVYYIPNGSPQSGNLGLAKGGILDHLSESYRVRSGMSSVPVWGTGGSAKVGEDIYALFLNNVRENKVEIRLMSLTAPQQLSSPVVTYQFDEVRQATIWLDEEKRTWFMFYRGEEEYGVKLAPFGDPDTTPPTAPEEVLLTSWNDERVDLTWKPAIDEDTGIAVYRIYLDDGLVDEVKGLNFANDNAIGLSAPRYEVSAVNYHGVEGPRSKINIQLVDFLPLLVR
jgi:hypothetical protein